MLKLCEYDADTLRNALRVARECFVDDAKVMRQQAAALRAGAPGGLFADGEPGALACDRLAAQFDRQIANTDELIDALDAASDEYDDRCERYA